MPRRRKRPGRRGLYLKRYTREEEELQRDNAFAAIRALYAEVLPLCGSCTRGFCRRHQRCCGNAHACVKRTWPLLSAAAQNRAQAQVATGGPRRLPPATHLEWALRRYPPTNFVL
jgi:hypothetical protein